MACVEDNGLINHKKLLNVSVISDYKNVQYSITETCRTVILKMSCKLNVLS